MSVSTEYRDAKTPGTKRPKAPRRPLISPMAVDHFLMRLGDAIMRIERTLRHR